MVVKIQTTKLLEQSKNYLKNMISNKQIEGEKTKFINRELIINKLTQNNLKKERDKLLFYMKNIEKENENDIKLFKLSKEENEDEIKNKNNENNIIIYINKLYYSNEIYLKLSEFKRKYDLMEKSRINIKEEYLRKKDKNINENKKEFEIVNNLIDDYIYISDYELYILKESYKSLVNSYKKLKKDLKSDIIERLKNMKKNDRISKIIKLEGNKKTIEYALINDEYLIRERSIEKLIANESIIKETEKKQKIINIKILDELKIIKEDYEKILNLHKLMVLLSKEINNDTGLFLYIINFKKEINEFIKTNKLGKLLNNLKKFFKNMEMYNIEINTEIDSRIITEIIVHEYNRRIEFLKIIKSLFINWEELVIKYKDENLEPDNIIGNIKKNLFENIENIEKKYEEIKKSDIDYLKKNKQQLNSLIKLGGNNKLEFTLIPRSYTSLKKILLIEYGEEIYKLHINKSNMIINEDLKNVNKKFYNIMEIIYIKSGNYILYGINFILDYKEEKGNKIGIRIDYLDDKEIIYTENRSISLTTEYKRI